MPNSRHNIRDVYPPTGNQITAKSWLTEAPMRMLMNNLHPDVAEDPHALVVYGGIGRAARTWEDYDKMVATLQDLETDETLLVQSGKPVGVFAHIRTPRGCLLLTLIWCHIGPRGIILMNWISAALPCMAR